MKNTLIVLICITSLLSCNTGVIEKPNNLIDENKMVDIIYDLSLLEAIRLDNPTSLQERKINPSAYIYKKYKIDSLQFAKSDQYYASDIKNYATIYDKVAKKLDNDKKIADELAKKNPIKQTELKPKDSARSKKFISDTRKKIKKIKAVKSTDTQK